MAKQLNVNLAFTADTSKAKSQLQDLQNELSKIMQATSQKEMSLGFSKELNEASKAAAELKAHLTKATNVKTGKLDLSLLNKSLKESGATLDQYREKLQKIGPSGEQAFNNLANNIMKAEVPIKQTNGLLAEFATTLKNTARWQISSNLLHSFFGSIQTAFYYAEDLNESLNNIRIVTGKSADEMADFAKQANSAAKALSTTTTEYTDAALIYYQQGLSESQVTERTDTTIKLANVARESAEEVSQQLTAIWNNFDNGSKSLEYYADVITALGAATASSSDEIAEGLEKFASVAETVGLSYEYATAALATVTATTRQSADIVGNAFKTLFARLEGLNLGETLDDGTDLNKYSEALDKVGINIKNTNGEMKNMDQILDEMGSKWGDLSKDQQIALAQTVAGVRQYTQLIALMDNWDYFQENLGVAQGAEGSLQEQADIYAESWEAARDRVTAAAEEIYDQLLDDDFFIDLTDAFSNLLELFSSLIDSLGGVQGIVAVLSSLLIKTFSKDLTNQVNNFAFGLQNAGKSAEQLTMEMREAAMKNVRDMAESSELGTVYEHMLQPQEAYINNAERMSEIERQTAEYLIEEHNERVKELGVLNESLSKAEELAALEEKRAERKLVSQGISNDDLANYQSSIAQYKQLNTAISQIQKFQNKGLDINGSSTAKELALVTKAFKNIDVEGVKFSKDIEKAFQILQSGTATALEASQALNTLYNSMDLLGQEGGLDAIVLEEIKTAIMGMAPSAEQGEAAFKKLINSIDKAYYASENFKNAEIELGHQTDSLVASFNRAESKPLTIGEKFVKGAQMLSSFAMSLSMLRGLIDTWNNEDISVGEKLLSSFITLGMVIPMVTSALEKNTLVTAGNTILKKLHITTSLADAAAMGTEAGAAATLEATLLPLLALFSSIAIAVGLVVGAGVLLVKGFEAIKANSPEGKLEAAKEAAEGAAEALKDVQQQITEITNDFDNLEKAYETLEDLTKGSEEWYQELYKINAQVSELLQKYPELAKYTYNDNGVFKISNEGIDSILQQENSRLASFTNVSLDAQKELNEAQYNKNLSDFEMGNFESSADYALAASKMYEQVGDYTFTREGAETLANALGTTLEEYLELNAETGAEDYENLVNEIEDFLESNRELIEQNGLLVKTNQQIADNQLSQMVSSLGSTMSADDAKKALGIDNYDELFENAGKKLEESFKWQDHINYDADNEYIKKFIDARFGQNSEAEYVAQQHGKLVVNLDGQEFEFTENEVKNVLIEQIVSEDFKTDISKSLQSSLNEAIGNVKLDGLELSELVNLDNLHRQLQQALSGIDSSEVDEVFSKIIQNAGTSEQELQNFSDKINSIDWDSADNIRNFNSAAEELESGRASIEEFTYALDKMAEAGKLEGMTDVFAQAAESMGLKEEDAGVMQEYAKNLMEIAKDSEDLADSLEVSADGAADLAIEITRMNKGIEDLSKGIEDWSSTLNKSSRDSQEYAEALYSMKNALSDILDVQSDMISSDFVESNLAQIEKAAKGDAEAIDFLRSKMDEEIILKITANLSEDAARDVQEAEDTLKALIDEMDISNLEVGVELSDEGFIEAANRLVQTAQMTADEANAYFAGIGYEPLYAVEEIPTQTQLPNGLTNVEFTEAGFNKGKIDLGPFGEHDFALPNFTTKVTSKALPPTGAESGMEAIAFSGGGKAPTIRKMRKKATGSQNNYSSSNSGGKALGKSSKSGGSKKDTKDIDKELDRYFDINNAISKTTNALEEYNEQLDELNAYQDHYEGETLIKSLKAQNELIDKQNDLLDVQINNYKALAEEQKKELSEIQGKLESIGGVFDGNVLTNYTQLMTDAINTYNKQINGSDSDNAEKRYTKIKETIERYQELYYSEMADTQQKIADALQEQLEHQLKIIENNLKGWEVEFELQLDTEEAERKLNDFLKDVETKFKKTYNDLSININFDSNSFDSYLKDTQTRLQQIAEVEAEITKMDAAKDSNGVVQLNDDMMFSSISEAQEYLKELQSELIDSGKSLNDMMQQIWDDYIDGLDQVADKFEDIEDEFDNINNQLEYEKELIELVYGEEAYDLMSKYYDTQLKNVEAQVSASKQQAEFWQNQFNEAYQMNKEVENITLDDMSTWTEDMRKAYDEMISAQETLNDLVISALQTIKDDYLNSIAKTLDALDKAVWGMSFKDLKADWDFIQKKADEYLDDVQGAYKIQSLANKINDSIANTADLKAQQKLVNLREDEIQYLRQKENLTQSDIDLAEARYQIALKEIALEEAQNSKTSMKLARDESGNWTYQYVADEDDVSNKQQELLDSYNNLYEIANEAYTNALNLAMETYEEYSEKLKEIAEDVTLTEEEKMVKMQELYDLYWPEIVAAMENAQVYEQETLMATAGVFEGVCQQDLEAYTYLTEQQQQLIDMLKEHQLSDYEEIRAALLDEGGFYSTLQSTAQDVFSDINFTSQTSAADMIEVWNEGSDSVKNAMIDTLATIINYTRSFEAEIVYLENVSGKNILGQGGVVSDFDTLGNRIDVTASKTNNLAEVAANNLSKMRKAISETTNSWSDMIRKINEATSAIQGYLSVAESLASLDLSGFGDIESLKNGFASIRSGGSGSGGSGSGSSGSGYSSASSSYSNLSGLAVGAGYDAYPDAHAGKIVITQNGRTAEVLDYDGTVKDRTETLSDWAQQRGYAGFGHGTGFATGGYTGEWGNEGKLAILHQKELVLNANDTSNMLDMVNTVRDITKLNDSIESVIAKSISEIMVNIAKAKDNYTYKADTQNDTNNIFNVTAEFPNADDVQTIKDAILSLPNLVSQYVNEK